MKKILLAAVAALAMVSCSQNEIDGIDNGKQDGRAEIKFSYTPVTRATVITSTTLGNFTVNAYANEKETYDADASSIIGQGYFEREKNEDGSNADTWSSTNKYYWPSNKNVHFFGYDVKSTEATFTKESTGYPTLKYTVPTIVASQHDLLVAKSEKQTYTPNSTVTLQFKHALTQVLFSLKGDDANVTYTVKSVTIKGVNKEGTYNYGTETWTPGSAIETTGYTATPTTSVAVSGTTATNLGTDNNTIFMLMPQTIPSGAKIAVTYSAKITLDGTETEIHSDSAPVEVDLAGEWTKGTKITYTLVLSGDKIKIGGTITADDDWTTPTTAPADVNVNN